jgi:hypothetical protein
MRAFFVLAALLIALSPASALAHGGVPHLQSKAAAADSFDQSWSPTCPPGSGHVCGCGNLSLCDGSGKPAPAVRCVVSLVSPSVAEVVALPGARARPAPQFAPNLPRAPPFFS